YMLVVAHAHDHRQHTDIVLSSAPLHILYNTTPLILPTLDTMRLVGPRPHLIEHNNQFSRLMENYHVRTFVKPGITGLAQVRGFRGEARDNSDIENRVACDIEYLENWNISLECAIILRTFSQLLFPPRTAY